MPHATRERRDGDFARQHGKIELVKSDDGRHASKIADRMRNEAPAKSHRRILDVQSVTALSIRALQQTVHRAQGPIRAVEPRLPYASNCQCTASGAAIV